MTFHSPRFLRYFLNAACMGGGPLLRVHLWATPWNDVLCLCNSTTGLRRILFMLFNCAKQNKGAIGVIFYKQSWFYLMISIYTPWRYLINFLVEMTSFQFILNEPSALHCIFFYGRAYTHIWEYVYTLWIIPLDLDCDGTFILAFSKSTFRWRSNDGMLNTTN